jgi:hypothetical protein
MYKRIDTPESAHWNSPLLNDIGFIKKHLRYPINKRTIWPLLGILLIGVWTMTIFLLVVLLSSNKARETGFTFNDFVPFVVIALVFIVPSLAMYRRIQSFRFISIKSSFVTSDNIKLIQQFLLKQNIAFYHNPNAAEVFQISSRILDIRTAQREIMVFIADDNRILLNSHFTAQNTDRGLKEIATGAHKKMAQDLKQWLKDNDKNYSHQFNLKKIGT